MSRHSVYRCYDKNGDLLYVGCSKDVGQRMKDHAKKVNSWVPAVQFMEVEKFADEVTARKAEKEAIRSEHPYWNNTERWQSRDDWTEVEYQRWGHHLLQYREGLGDRGVRNYEQTEALHRIYMITFGRPFPANPQRGTSRRRYVDEVAA